MSILRPPNAEDVRAVVETRLAALDSTGGIPETVAVEWRGQQRSLPVITMPVDLLTYNPATHRVRAQRSLDPVRDHELDANPFSPAAQAYLHDLLMGDPADPTRVDPSFEALKEDLRQHGQNDPGIITRDGVLINGNTRRAALKTLGQEHIRVGVLPPDAGHDDLQSIELALQLRKDHRREYSFMNFLLALDERVAAGRPAHEIQSDFRIKAATFERSRWILAFIRDAIERSRLAGAAGDEVAMRLIDFESDQGKLEELYRAYSALSSRSPDEAEALREQRLLAIVLGKSKTDVRLIGPDFTETYMKRVLPASSASPAAVRIPGTGITVAAWGQKVQALKELTDGALRARAAELAPGAVSPTTLREATGTLDDLKSAMDEALDQAGKQGRVIKRRFAAADRLADANDDLELARAAVAEARATGNFDPEDLDEVLQALRDNLTKLAHIVNRGQATLLEAADGPGEGRAWLLAVAALSPGAR